MHSSPEPTIQLVFNPTSGSHQRAQVRDLRAALVARGARVILSVSAPDVAIEIDPAAERVCAMGGDGTLRHVVAAVIDSGRDLPVSVFPAGTINLVHREMETPVDLSPFAAALTTGDTDRDHFAATLNETLFLACASCGPDSRAVAGVTAERKRALGRFAYAAAFLGVLADWSRPSIRLVHDGGETDCEAFYVAKGRYFAGPWSFAPAARLDRPSLHVVALRRARRRDYLGFLWRLLRGIPLEGWTNAVLFECTRLHAAGARLPVQADGDIVGFLPVTIALSPRPLRMG